MNKMTIWNCNNCGLVNDVQLYNSNLKKPGFKLGPILPVCNNCGETVILSKDIKKYNKRILILTGPCGSGKTSIAEYLYQNKEFNIVDLDSIIDLVQNKYKIKGVDYNSKEAINELVESINILLHYNNDIAVSYIIDPDKIEMYKNIFHNFGLSYKIIFLYSNYLTILKRTKTRTCFNSITPEKWVKHFYDKMIPLKDIVTENYEIIDNTNLSLEETVNAVLNTFN